MNLWQFLGCQDEYEQGQLVRDVSRHQCPAGGRCSTAKDCPECWRNAIDRVKEVKFYGECENDVDDD